MADLNRRFSRSQWNKNGISAVPLQNGLPGNGNGNGSVYGSGNGQYPPGGYNTSGASYSYNATNSSLNVNDYGNRSNNTTVLHPNMMTSAESIHSNAMNGTTMTTRRRFSMKLSQPPLDAYNTYGAPALPYNAQSQILQSSFTNASETFSATANDDGHHPPLSAIQQNNYSQISNIDNNGRSPQKAHYELLSELTTDNFDASRYVQIKLGDANAARIDDFSTYMETLNVANDDAVKYSLSESTSQVLAVSEAFRQTHEVLLSLKPKVNDLTDILSQQLEEAHEYQDKAGTNSAGPAEGNNQLDVPNSKLNRQSVMLLQNKWSNAMKKLYANIDRAHDLLPPLPSRHIIIESRRWGELNSITCNPVRPVHIVVMNDSILVASRVRDSSKYLNGGKSGSNSKKSKSSRNIATHLWMIDKITVQKCSEIKELNEVLSHNSSHSFSKGANPSSSDSESAADSTLCIKTIDGNQTFLFQTDLSTEFTRVFSAVQQARAEMSSMKRRSMRDSISKLNLAGLNNKPDSRHVSMAGISQNSNSLLEKQAEPELNACVSAIDDLLTSASLELGLQRYDECVGYLTRLDDELRHLAQIATTVGIPKSLLSSKTLTTNSKNGSQVSVLTQQIHFTYNIKMSSLKNITDQLVDALLDEISSSSSSLDSLKEYIDIFKILKREKEAAEIYLESRGRELVDCVGMVRVGGGYSGNSSHELSSTNPKGLLGNDRGLSRSSSSRAITGLTSRPTSMSNTPDPEAENETEDVSNVNLDSIGGVTGELITAYVRELSLVYMGFVSRVWDEWNMLFTPQKSDPADKKGAKTGISSVRIIEWVNEYMAELKRSVQLVLVDYERNGEVFMSSLQTMKVVFEGLKQRELNVDYLLEI